MARYDYFCRNCEVAEEIQWPITESEPEGGHPCPRCGHRMMRQYILNPAIHFKGFGFYSKDKGQS